MDDFDIDNLGETPIEATPSKSTQQIEDELFDFLDTPSAIPTTFTTPNAKESSGGFSITSQSMDDSQDFLSWLEETPTAKSSSFIKPPPLSTVAEEPSEIAPEIVNESIDNFFDEVFGDSVPSPSASSKSNAFFQSDSIIYTNELKEIIESSFPDVNQLKQIVFDHGYVPNSLRAQVWTLILSGSFTEDEEMRQFTAPAGAEIGNKKGLVSDCKELSKNVSSKSKQEQVNHDLQDVLLLYCQRRNLHYLPIYGMLLSPLMAVSEPASKAVASSCFYGLTSMFVPLLTLNVKATEIASNALHLWLRLLLSYHSPALVQHLDRVLPGWEQSVSASQSTETQHSKASSGLDELERELGLSTPDTSTTSTLSSPSDGVIESAHKSRIVTGCIPSHWITAVFTGSLPPQHSAVLLDWAILNNVRYAGFYFVVSLLEIFSQSLLKMNGSSIRVWFDGIASNNEDWFKSISVHTAPVNTGKDTVPSEVIAVDNWTSFVRGWIHSTAVLINGTPQAFKDTLNKTEEWASETAEKNKAAAATELNNAKQLLKSKFTDLEDGSEISDDIFGDDEEDVVEGDDDEEEDGEEEVISPQPSVASGTGSKLMAQFRRLSAQFQGDSQTAGSNQPSATSSKWVADSKSTADTICVWADSAEVVPCICSNRRRPLAPEDVLLTFQSAAGSSSLSKSTTAEEVFNVCFSLTGATATEKPFFFGIDCRTDVEKSLGQFPKAFAMDPASITDIDAVSQLLQIVEPMATSAHICIIGSGEDYLRWQFKQHHAKKYKKCAPGTEPAELVAAITEQHNRLKAVAMFFLKKSFRHISILDGGFVAAVRYLHRPDSSFSLAGSLVDVDKYAIESLLGLPSTAPPKVSLLSKFENALENAILPDTRNQPKAVVQPATAATVNPPSTTSAPSGTASTAPSALQSVGSFWNSLGNKPAPSAATAPTAAGGVRAPSPSVAPAASVPAPASSISTAAPTATTPSTAPPAAAAAPNPNVVAASQFLSGWGKKISAFSATSLDTIKKNVAAYQAPTAAATAPAQQSNVPQAPQKSFDFVIDDEEEDDGMGPREIPDSNGITISRTDLERAHALALHKLAGLQKGDQITINRTELPGAVLFPCLKVKEIFVDDESLSGNKPVSSSSSSSTVGGASGNEGESKPEEGSSNMDDLLRNLEGEEAPAADKPLSIEPPVAVSAAELARENANKIKKEIHVHRFLVVSKERFLVLDSNGGGVGSVATIKSNHHLTELIKMTFRKKDPELVTLHFLNNFNPDITKTRQYRVGKRKDFIEALQKNMQRFK